MRRAFFSGLLLAAAALLSACTGIVEDPPPIRIVIAEGATSLRTVPVNTNDAPNSATTTSTIFGVRTLGAGGTVAVLLPDQVEVRDASLNLVGSFRTSTFLPDGTLPADAPKCFSKLRVSESGARVAALYSCQSDPTNPNDPVTIQQRLALFDNAGNVLWARNLPGALTFSAALIHLAVLGDSENTVLLARPTSVGTGSGTDVLRFNRDNSALTSNFVSDPKDPRILLLTVPSTDPSALQPVRDLAVARGTVYAATAAGVQPVPLTGGALGTAVITGGASRVFSGQQGQLLAAWNSDNSTLAVTNFASSQTFTNVTELRDVTFSDFYLYALSRNNLTRFEVARLGRADSPTGGTYLSGANDGRFAAFAVPPVAAP